MGKPLLSSPDDAGTVSGSASVGGLLLACGVIGPPVDIAVFTVEGRFGPDTARSANSTACSALGHMAGSMSPTSSSSAC